MVDLKESVKKALDERVTSPLFGYILLSWIAFNWKGLATLFMSKLDVEERIRMISQTAELSWSFWSPLLIGTTLAIFSPYMHFLLEKIHHRAQIWRVKSASNMRKINYLEETSLAKEKVRSQYEERRESQKQEIREAILQARKTKILLGINEMDTTAKALSARINKLLRDALLMSTDVEAVQRAIDDFILEYRKLPVELKNSYGIENFEHLKSVLMSADYRKDVYLPDSIEYQVLKKIDVRTLNP